MFRKCRMSFPKSTNIASKGLSGTVQAQEPQTKDRCAATSKPAPRASFRPRKTSSPPGLRIQGLQECSSTPTLGHRFFTPVRRRPPTGRPCYPNTGDFRRRALADDGRPWYRPWPKLYPAGRCSFLPLPATCRSNRLLARPYSDLKHARYQAARRSHRQ